MDGEEWEETFKNIGSTRKPALRCLKNTQARETEPFRRGIRLSQIDEVVLVGGATKLPIVRQFISRLFRRVPDTHINPDEAVALGAAIQAAMKDRNDAIREVILTDVCSFTLGTEVAVKERISGQYESGHFCPIIERNTVIPASRTERFYTIYDDQTKISIPVLQGESRFASNNLLLGRVELEVPKTRRERKR